VAAWGGLGGLAARGRGLRAAGALDRRGRHRQGQHRVRAPYDRQRLDECIRITCLKQDIDSLPRGELTVVSASTLSGGQRQRVALARAAYSKAPLVVIDDCLSALDQKVSQEVFHLCIEQWMAGRTRVLATNVSFVPPMAQLVVLVKPLEWVRAKPAAGGSPVGPPAPATRGNPKHSGSVVSATMARLKASPVHSDTIAQLLQKVASADEGGALLPRPPPLSLRRRRRLQACPSLPPR